MFQAAEPIVDLEYTIYDGLVHGFGVDIVPPTLGREDLKAAKTDGYDLDDPIELEENMAFVVQPNSITTDERYGFRLGIS